MEYRAACDCSDTKQIWRFRPKPWFSEIFTQG